MDDRFTAAEALWPILQGISDGLPPVVGELLETFSVLGSPAGTAFYGGGGIVTLVVLRNLLRRVRGRGGARSRAATTSTTPSGHGKHNVAFTLPSFVPVSEGIRHVTHTEIHAFELGLVVGLAVSWLNSLGRTEPAIAIVVAVIAGGLGFKAYSSKAFRTIRHEPWYAFMAMAIAAAAGYVYFGGAPA